ncbi:MAG: O-antigen ligase family protein [Opitutaceae bacterium]|nr:O-antigen ligase family protein [Opitutaceae bacterium]
MHATAANSSRPSWPEWIVAGLLGVNVAWTTLGLGGFRAETRVVTWGLTGLALLVFLAGRAWTPGRGGSLHPAGWALAPFVAYAAFNAGFVSPVPWLGWLDWLGWVNLAVTFWLGLNGLRSGAPRRALFFVVIALGVGAVGLGCYQHFVQPDWLVLDRRQAAQFVGRASGPFGIPNSLAGFLILIVPATGALAWRSAATGRIWWGWVTAVLMFGLFLTFSRGAWLSLVLALIAWPLLASKRTWPRRLAFAGAVLGGVIVLTIFLHGSSPQARERLDRLVSDGGELSRPILWRGAWELWRAEPVLGTGAGSFNVLFERHRPAGFVDEPQWAHNEYLNTLSDYGLVGLSLTLGAAIWVIVRARRRGMGPGASTVGRGIDSPAVRNGFGVGCLAFALQLGVDFHLKLPALGMLFALVAALAVGRSSGEETSGSIDGKRSLRVQAGWLTATLLVAFGLWCALRWEHAEALRADARETLDRELRRAGEPRLEVARRAETALHRSVGLWPQHGGAWADLAHALHVQAYIDPARSRPAAAPAEAAARRALALSEVVPDFWLRLGVALDMQGRRTDAISAYEHALRLAPRSATGWYYYADHLSRDTKTREAALRAIATCLSLDPGNADAEALRAKLGPVP